MYRGGAAGVIVYHNINERKHIDVPHLHSQYEIYYNIHGAKGFFVNKNFYSCTGHDLFVVPKAQVHKVIVMPDTQYERCIISIDSKITDSINSMPHLGRALDWLDCVGHTLPAKVNLNNKDHSVFMQLVEQYNSAKDELKRFAVLIDILAFTGSFFKTARPVKNIEPDSIVGKALIIIEEKFRDIKISEIAEKLYMNDKHLSKIFKDECGVTLSSYLILRKLAEAKKYLYMGVSVKEVCTLSGFNNYSNFIRTFKKFEGCSPGNIQELSEPI